MPRAEVPLVDTSEGATKINPLANWTWGDVWHYIRRKPGGPTTPARPVLPQHRLRALHPRHQPGRDFRAGRWWWEDEAARNAACTSNTTASVRSMNAMTEPTHFEPASATAHLDALERKPSSSCAKCRRVRAPRPAVLRRQGLAGHAQVRRKAFGAAASLPAADDRHRPQLPEVTDFRDFRAKELGAELIVRSVEDSMARGTVRLAHPGESRNVHQSVTLLEAIEEFRFDAR